jgi:hypothetical protein
MDEPQDEQQDHRADEGHNDRADYAFAGRNPQHASKESANHRANDADDDIDDQAKPTTFGDYTLYRANTGTPVAQLRPTGQNDQVEVLYWSLWKERWTNAGPLGRTVPPLDDAPRLIASEDIFWASR